VACSCRIKRRVHRRRMSAARRQHAYRPRMTDYDGARKFLFLYLIKKRAHALLHFQYAFAAARPIRMRIAGPGIDLGAGNVIPGAHFPGAEMHFGQTGIVNHLIRCKSASQGCCQFAAAPQRAGKHGQIHRQHRHQGGQNGTLIRLGHAQVGAPVANAAGNFRRGMPDQIKTHNLARSARSARSAHPALHRQQRKIKRHFRHLLHRAETIPCVTADAPDEFACKPDRRHRACNDTGGQGLPG
jgi:hypothetical protein